MPVCLGVNLDHVATVRQARRGIRPDPLHAAILCELSGADSIVVHLREDRRHIQDDDVERFRRAIHIRLNLEMSMNAEIVQIAQKIKPNQVTFVPERREELTTECGLKVIKQEKRVGLAIEKLQRKGIVISLFVDADKKNIQAAQRVGAEFIELHTGAYALARTEKHQQEKLKELIEGTQYAQSLGLGVNAGHGLDYWNVKPVAQIKDMQELNIGHAIIARAVLVGISQAVREMKELINITIQSSPVRRVATKATPLCQSMHVLSASNALAVVQP